LTSKAWSEITDEQRAQAREARREKKRNVNALEVEKEDESEAKKRKCSVLNISREIDHLNISKDEREHVGHFRPGDQITRRPNKKI